MLKILAPSEGLVMNCIWEANTDLTVREIKDQINSKHQKIYALNTIGTFLSILIDKGFVKRYKIKTAHQYTALISKDEYLAFATKKILDTLYDGSITTFIGYAMSAYDFTKDDLTQIKKLLDEKS